MKKNIFPLLLCVLVGCVNTSQSSDDQDVVVRGDTILVNPKAVVSSKIKTIKVDTTTFAPSFSTSGVIRAIPSCYAEVSLPFDGRIVKSCVKLGQHVSKGAPLFEISSPDFFEASKNYFHAQQDMELAYKTYQREKDLLSNKVGVVKDVEEAEAIYYKAKQEVDNSAAVLRAFNIDVRKLTVGQSLTVISPIAGDIVKNTLVIGQYVKTDAEPQVLVADLDQVWVVANVRERDLPLVNQIRHVKVELAMMPGQLISGEVINVGELLDPDTRSVEVVVACDNPNHIMKPNLYGTVIFTDVAQSVLMIPNSALLQAEESAYVVKKIGPNSYKKIAVKISAADAAHSVVTSGLNIGDEIIAEGAYYLIDYK